MEDFKFTLLGKNTPLYKSILYLFFILNSFCIVAQSPEKISALSNSVNVLDYNQNAIDNIDLRIAIKHDPATNKKIYSIENKTTGTFTRNTNCWAADLDLTCASPWNSHYQNLRAGTLITPRHAILAAHYILNVGDTLGFVTKDNVTIKRKIIAYKTNANGIEANVPDMQIVTLESDVPSQIAPCQIFPANYATYLSNDGLGLPSLYLDYYENALVADIQKIKNRYYTLQTPTAANRLALNEPIITGDSGNPVFIVLNNKPVLLGVVTWIASGSVTGSGNLLSYYVNYPDGASQPYQNLNDLIKASDATIGINTGYKISLFDFNAATAVQEVNFQNNYKVYCVNQTLNIESNTHGISQITIYNILGKQINKQISKSPYFSFTLPSKGIYIVNIRNNTERESFKVIAN